MPTLTSLRESKDLERCQSEYREKGKKYQAVYEWSEGVEQIVGAGRARWKIENEQINTLLDIYDERYRLLRAERGRRDQFFAELGTLTRYWYFEGWEALMVFMITQLELPDPGS